jgi:hypothetical protein
MSRVTSSHVRILVDKCERTTNAPTDSTSMTAMLLLDGAIDSIELVLSIAHSAPTCLSTRERPVSRAHFYESSTFNVQRSSASATVVPKSCHIFGRAKRVQ